MHVLSKVPVLDAHMMWSFLDLSDNRLAVVLKRTGDHHKAGEDQIALQRLTTHLSYLRRDTPLTLMLILSERKAVLNSYTHGGQYLLVAQVSHLLVSQGQNTRAFTRHLFVDFVIVGWTLWKLEQNGIKVVCNFWGTQFSKITIAPLLEWHISFKIGCWGCAGCVRIICFGN